jgi:hypothetical protein
MPCAYCGESLGLSGAFLAPFCITCDTHYPKRRRMFSKDEVCACCKTPWPCAEAKTPASVGAK